MVRPGGAAVESRIRSREENLTDCPKKNALNIGSGASWMLVEWGWDSGEQKDETNKQYHQIWMIFFLSQNDAFDHVNGSFFYCNPVRLLEYAVKNNAIKSQM